MSTATAFLKDAFANSELQPTSFLKVFLLGMLLWCVSHPYVGILYDARLYVTYAYHHLFPEMYAQDPLLLFGFQDSLSVFSWLVAPVIEFFGADSGAKLLTGTFGLLYILAIWSLSRALPKQIQLLTFFCLSSAVLAYLQIAEVRPMNRLAITEGLLASRSLAACVGILSLSCLLRKRVLLCVGLAVLSTLLHPLTGIWMLLLLVTQTAHHLLKSSERLAVLGLLAVVGVVLLLNFLENVSPSFSLIAGDWKDYLQLNDPTAFLAKQSDLDTGWTVFRFAILYAGVRLGHRSLRHLYSACLVLSCCAMLLFAVLSMFLTLQLPIQCQLWRVQWLAGVCCLVALTDVSAQLFRFQSVFRRFAKPQLKLLAVGACCSFSFPFLSGVLLFGILCRSLRRSLRSAAQLSVATSARSMSRPTRVGLLILFCLAFGFLMQEASAPQAAELMNFYCRLHQLAPAAVPVYSQLLIHVLAVFAFGASGATGVGVWILWHLRRQLREKGALLVWSSFGVLVTMCVFNWTQFAVPVTHGDRSELRTRIPEGSLVYWPLHGLEVTATLHSANYLDASHAAVFLLSEKAFSDFRQRLQKLHAVCENDCRPEQSKVVSKEMLRFWNPLLLFISDFPKPAIIKFCSTTSTDFLIIRTNVPELQPFQVPRPEASTQDWYAYACSSLRSAKKE